MLTDQPRLEQIIKNLLSNAFKFTPEHGKILLAINKAKPDTLFFSQQLKNYDGNIIAIQVKDSGIGISPDKQKLIFEAFQQADGSTSRKYGGTGLGLSISKELAHILGGEIQVESKQGEGSTFTLYVPEKIDAGEHENQDIKIEEEYKTVTPISPEPVLTIPNSSEGQKLLIIEDDLVFADVLNDYAIEKALNPYLPIAVMSHLIWLSLNCLMPLYSTLCFLLWMDGPYLKT